MRPGPWGRAPGDGRHETGAAAVEFALVLVLFLTLLFGMIQYSLYFLSTQSSAAAAREGARRSAVGNQSCSALRAAAASNVRLADSAVTAQRTYYDASDSTFTTPVPAAVDRNVKVTIRYNSVDLNLPFVPFIDDGKVVSTAYARVENLESPVSASVACP